MSAPRPSDSQRIHHAIAALVARVVVERRSASGNAIRARSGGSETSRADSRAKPRFAARSGSPGTSRRARSYASTARPTSPALRYAFPRLYCTAPLSMPCARICSYAVAASAYLPSP
jgi:hypothetical protein